MYGIINILIDSTNKNKNNLNSMHKLLVMCINF